MKPEQNHCGWFDWQVITVKCVEELPGFPYFHQICWQRKRNCYDWYLNRASPAVSGRLLWCIFSILMTQVANNTWSEMQYAQFAGYFWVFFCFFIFFGGVLLSGISDWINLKPRLFLMNAGSTFCACLLTVWIKLLRGNPPNYMQIDIFSHIVCWHFRSQLFQMKTQ